MNILTANDNATHRRLLPARWEAEGVTVVNAADGALLEINPAGLRRIGDHNFQRVEKHRLYPLVVVEDRKAFRALIERVMRGESGIQEYQFVGLKGARRGWPNQTRLPP